MKPSLDEKLKRIDTTTALVVFNALAGIGFALWQVIALFSSYGLAVLTPTLTFIAISIVEGLYLVWHHSR